MTDNISMIVGSFLLGLVLLATSGCVVAPPEREGYYDHHHHRYYHEHSWHACVEHDPYCR
jgi:hypothetical protein